MSKLRSTHLLFTVGLMTFILLTCDFLQPISAGTLLKLKKIQKILPYLLALQPSKKILLPLPIPLPMPLPMLKFSKQFELPSISFHKPMSWPMQSWDNSWGGNMGW